MSTPGPGVGGPAMDSLDPAPSALDPARARFREHLETAFRDPLHDALEEYGRALAAVTHRLAALTPAPLPEKADAGEKAQARHDYAIRFLEAFDEALLEPADRAKDAFFARLDEPAGVPDLPETVVTLPAPPGAAAPDPRLRPGLGRRALSRLRRRGERTVPVRALAEFHTAELLGRLEEAANLAASLDSLALATMRRQLHDAADPVPAPDADDLSPPPVTAGEELTVRVAAAARAVDAAIEETELAFARDVAAAAVQVDPELATSIRGRTGGRSCSTFGPGFATEPARCDAGPDTRPSPP